MLPKNAYRSVQEVAENIRICSVRINKIVARHHCTQISVISILIPGATPVQNGLVNSPPHRETGGTDAASQDTAPTLATEPRATRGIDPRGHYGRARWMRTADGICHDDRGQPRSAVRNGGTRHTPVPAGAEWISPITCRHGSPPAIAIACRTLTFKWRASLA